jgi:hypothetical protein
MKPLTMQISIVQFRPHSLAQIIYRSQTELIRIAATCSSEDAWFKFRKRHRLQRLIPFCFSSGPPGVCWDNRPTVFGHGHCLTQNNYPCIDSPAPPYL